MSFDPGEMTVKDAVKEIAGLSDSDLSAIYDAELDGKGRKSLLDKITAMRDDLREASAESSEGTKGASSPLGLRVIRR